MQHRRYCLYCTDAAGKLRRAHDIAAFTDMSAIAQAEVMRRTDRAILCEEEREVRVFAGTYRTTLPS